MLLLAAALACLTGVEAVREEEEDHPDLALGEGAVEVVEEAASLKTCALVCEVG